MDTSSQKQETPGWLAKRCLDGAVWIGKLGFPGIERIARVLGWLFWICLPSRRRLAVENIKKHLGYLPSQAPVLARASFTHNARSFLECLLAPEFSETHPLLRVRQPELLERLRTELRPAVIVSAHLGAWELLSSLLGDLPDSRPRLTVVRKYKNPILHYVSTTLRSAHGTAVLGHREAAFPVLRALKRNGFAAFLVDHNTSQSEAVFLPFLGEEAAVNKGPALLAVRAHALVWPITLLREPDGTYNLQILEPLDTTTLEGSVETKIEATAAFYTQQMELMVHKAPEQWFWMHNRWKTKRP